MERFDIEISIDKSIDRSVCRLIDNEISIDLSVGSVSLSFEIEISIDPSIDRSRGATRKICWGVLNIFWCATGLFIHFCVVNNV